MAKIAVFKKRQCLTLAVETALGHFTKQNQVVTVSNEIMHLYFATVYLNSKTSSVTRLVNRRDLLTFLVHAVSVKKKARLKPNTH